MLTLLQQQLEASGQALLLVTHDAALAAHLANRRLHLGPPVHEPVGFSL